MLKMPDRVTMVNLYQNGRTFRKWSQSAIKQSELRAALFKSQTEKWAQDDRKKGKEDKAKMDSKNDLER